MLNTRQTIIPLSAARCGRKLSGFKGVTIHETHTVSQIDGNKVLLGYPNGICSWIPISGVVKA